MEEEPVKTLDVLCLGELLIDFVSDTPGADLGGSHGFIKAPGGAPANVAVGITRLGHRAGFVGCVGDDAFGRFLRGVLDQEGVDTNAMRVTSEGDTTLAFVSRRADGEREFAFYRRAGADTLLRPDDLGDELLGNTRALHCCSVSMSREPARGATFYALERARQLGALVSFDVNIRPPLWDDLAEAKGLCLRAMQLADVVKVSDDEARWLSGRDDLDRALEALWMPSNILLVITLGAEGCRFRHVSGSGEIPGIPAAAVDTTGAGDSFVAGLLSSLLDAGGHPERLSTQQVRASLAFANACGAITTTMPGAIPSLPTRLQAELLAAQYQGA